MKFLVDAQLPRRLAHRLRQEGHEAIHTLDLPLGNRTPDHTLNEISVREHWVVITKDEDFVTSFHLSRQPRQLLLISTGNIRNAQLEAILLSSLAEIEAGFRQFDFLEITRTTVLFRA